MLKKTVFSLLLLIATLGQAQNNYPPDYFRSPVDTTIALAGNFGEIRPNHFHAGFDIKTNGKEGMPIYAVADGYISRIKISAFGYGKALYITHPNGFTSVYGHLSVLEGTIAQLTYNVQSQKQLFEIDTLLQADVLPVKKGQLIALSGNTGGSQGPHLHFEIRESATEKPINPYFFGFKIKDEVKPKITSIVVYPMDENAEINGKNLLKKIKPLFLKGNYSVNKADSLTLSGNIGFGIETYDTESGSSNQNGVYSIELQSGGKRIYYHELEKFSFENARYVNAHIDYADKQKHNTKIQKCFLSKNNMLGIYKNVLNNGIIAFNDDSIHWIRFIVKDFVGNTTELMLKVKGKSPKKEANSSLTQQKNVDCLKDFTFEKNGLKLSIPANALYDDTNFEVWFLKQPTSVYSQTYHILNDEVALQKAITISIQSLNLPPALENKACIVSIDEKGKKSYAGGSFKDGMVTTQTKSFGNYAIAIDTIAPKLKTAFKYVPNSIANLNTAKTIGIVASDNLSGIRKYKANIDGKWVLVEYEYKKSLLFYTFNNTITPGEHTFSIDVTDDKENTSTLSFKFKR